ncbi:MAG TPA: glutamate--cysteine ligase, partial [Candidatus Macondimonas sp.]|nr:glutamate--cysteine ligase [Candidatus Macondimonas sp.]
MARPEPTTIPLLNRQVHGPVQLLEATLLAQQTTIEYWFRRQWQHTRPPLYASVDLRNAGFKLAPVDTNLFPAGFNNLSADCQPLCVQAMRQAIERSCPTASRVLIVPESHTRNPYYLDSLGTLAGIVAQAGFEVRIGSLRPDLTEPAPLESRTVRHLQLEPLVRQGARIGVADFDPCLVLLNNDLSGGLPAILQNIEQTVLPPPGLGWT